MAHHPVGRLLGARAPAPGPSRARPPGEAGPPPRRRSAPPAVYSAPGRLGERIGPVLHAEHLHRDHRCAPRSASRLIEVLRPTVEARAHGSSQASWPADWLCLLGLGYRREGLVGHEVVDDPLRVPPDALTTRPRLGAKEGEPWEADTLGAVADTPGG